MYYRDCHNIVVKIEEGRVYKYLPSVSAFRFAFEECYMARYYKESLYPVDVKYLKLRGIDGEVLRIY